jgi:hypothetical protein
MAANPKKPLIHAVGFWYRYLFHYVIVLPPWRGHATLRSIRPSFAGRLPRFGFGTGAPLA